MVEYAALLPPYKKLDIKQVLQNIIMRKILLLILNLMAVRRCVQRRYGIMPTMKIKLVLKLPFLFLHRSLKGALHVRGF